MIANNQVAQIVQRLNVLVANLMNIIYLMDLVNHVQVDVKLAI